MIKKTTFLSLLILLIFVNSLYAEKTIGVTAFKNLTMDKKISWLEVGIADSISYKLRNVKDYIVVDRTNVDKIVKEIQLGQSGLIDDKQAKQAGKALGADIIIVGNFSLAGNRIRINAKLVEVESHKVLKQVQSTGVLDNIFELQDEIALKIINQTNIQITKELKKKITEHFTKDVSAYEYYVNGQKYLLSQLNYQKAIEMFDKAISIDKNYSLAYAGLGKAYSLRSWEIRTYENREDPSLLEKSFENSKKALEISPDMDEAHLSLAKYYQEVDKNKVPNKWELCEKETRKALEINPNNGDALFLLSRIYGYDDKKEEEYLLKSIEKNKFITDAHNNLGVIYLDRGNYDLAIKYFNNAIEIDPGFKLGYMNLGVVYDRKGDLNKALEMYKAVLDKYPDYIRGILNLGIGYRKLQKYDEAMVQFEKALKIQPQNSEAWGEIGYVYLSKGQYSQAISPYKKSLQYEPDYYYGLANIGYCYAEIGDYQNAIYYLKMAHNKHTDKAWPAGHMGWIYRYKLNDNKNAKYWYGEASKREPNNQNYKKSYNEL